MTPTTIVPFTSTLTHVSICAHHTWWWKGRKCIGHQWHLQGLKRLGPSAMALCPFSWLPHGCSSWRLCSSHAPFSVCSGLTPTALAPHSYHVQKDGPGSWLLPRLPSASLFVSFHHHLSLNCFSSENNSSLESDQRPSEQLNVIAQNYTDLNRGTLLCLSLRKLKA